MKKGFTLSKKEKELMDIFWDADAPLSRAEILERADERKCTWKPNSVHILLNSLLDKKAVQVAGYYLSSRKLGRTFEPALSREDYAVMQVELAANQARKEGVKGPGILMSALFRDSVNDETLDEIIKAVEAKKQELRARKKN